MYRRDRAPGRTRRSGPGAYSQNVLVPFLGICIRLGPWHKARQDTYDEAINITTILRGAINHFMLVDSKKKQQRLIAIKRPGRYEVLDGNLRRIDGDGAARPVGGALEAGAPPPKEGRWSSTALSLSAGASVPVPLLLAEPSALHLSITPKGGGGAVESSILPKCNKFLVKILLEVGCAVAHHA